jgi:hypothetical protein
MAEDVGEEVAGGARRGEAWISGDWRMKWRWWFLWARRIGTRSSANPTPPTSTQRWRSGAAAASDVGSRRASTSSRHPVTLVGRRRQHLTRRLCRTTVLLEGQTTSCAIPRRVATDRATPHDEHAQHHGESALCAGCHRCSDLCLALSHHSHAFSCVATPAVLHFVHITAAHHPLPSPRSGSPLFSPVFVLR